MKIDQLYFKQTGDVSAPQGAGRKEQAVSGASFADILNGMSGPVENSGAVSGNVHMPPESITSLQGSAMAEGENVLDMLEHLGGMLESGDSSSGSMEALADTLHSRLETLVEARNSLDANDPLRQTVNEIGILAAVQEARINRGDYS